MTRIFGYSLCIYFAFAWQASLRPDLAWNGCSPNFLALVLIGSCVLLNDVSALFAAAMLGLLSDSLAPRGLGPDVLCYLVLIIALQGLCPPKLVRNSAVLLVILCLSTALLEFSGEVLRATLNHELPWQDPTTQARLMRWLLTALGNGIYTSLVAVFPLLISRGLTNRIVRESQDAFANRWHRLTSM
jgi:cell shape-determining protein MreD